MNRIQLAALALAALALAACGGDATGPKGALPAADARDLAASMTALTGASAFSASAPRYSGDGTYTFDVGCPAGGTVSAEVKLSGSASLQTQSAKLDFSGTQTSKQCATRTSDGVTIAVTGSTTFTAHLELAAGKPASETLTQKGSFDWTRGAESGHCTVDVTAQFDPATQKATVTGTYCGVTL